MGRHQLSPVCSDLNKDHSPLILKKKRKENILQELISDSILLGFKNKTCLVALSTNQSFERTGG